MKTAMLTGATGLLGPVLQRRLAEDMKVVPVARTAPPDGMALDLTDAKAVAAAIRSIRPDCVVHAAALANVDQCERDPAEAWRQNVIATGNIRSSLGKDARLVVISTDQVYDGAGPHGEEAPSPANVYALTKLWAEDRAKTHANAILLRTNFFGPADADKGFLAWLLKSLREKAPITLFDDVLFNPLSAPDLADIVAKLVVSGETGVVNVGAGDDEGLSKAEFGRRVASVFGLGMDNVRIGSVADVELAARRPNDMRMRVSLLTKILGSPPPTVDEGLKRVAGLAMAAA